MGWKSMKFVYYSNTWHDILAKVEMLGDGKRSLGPGAKKKKKTEKNRDLRIIQEIKNNMAQ